MAVFYYTLKYNSDTNIGNGPKDLKFKIHCKLFNYEKNEIVRSDQALYVSLLLH